MIVLVQMLAVSRLSSPSRLPWEEEGEGWELSASPHSLFQRAPAPRPDDQQPANGASSPSAPLEHVSLRRKAHRVVLLDALFIIEGEALGARWSRIPCGIGTLVEGGGAKVTHAG